MIRSVPWRPFVAMLVVVGCAAGLRLWGLGWQLPYQLHPDEAHYTWKAAADMIGGNTLDPKYFRNPTLFTYVLYAQYRALGFQPPKVDELAAVSDGWFRPPSGVAFVGRLNSAILGVATVAALGALGWYLYGAWLGVAAAALLAVAFIHVRDSHYATNDVPAAMLLTCAIGCMMVSLRQRAAGWLVLGAIAGGLASSTKYNAGLFVAPFVATAACNILRATSSAPNRRPRTRAWFGFARLAATGGILAALAFVVGSPYAVLTPSKFWADFATQARFCGEGWEGQTDPTSVWLYLLALGHGVGWLTLGLAGLGIWLLGRARLVETLVLLSFPVAYMAYMQRCELFFVRFALPLVPFACLFAAVTLRTLATRVGHRSWPAIAATALAIAAISEPASRAIQHDLLVGRPDTRVLAAEWALANVAPTDKVLIEEYTIRDFRPRSYDGPSWRLDTDLFKVTEVRSGDPVAALRGGGRYFISSSFQSERFTDRGPRPGAQRAFYDALATESRLVATFGPARGGGAVPFDLEDLYTPFWRLDRYERPGPTIRIYDLRATP